MSELACLLNSVRTVAVLFTEEDMMVWDPCYASTVLYLEVGVRIRFNSEAAPTHIDPCGWSWVEVVHGTGSGGYLITSTGVMSGWMHPGITR